MVKDLFKCRWEDMISIDLLKGIDNTSVGTTPLDDWIVNISYNPSTKVLRFFFSTSITRISSLGIFFSTRKIPGFFLLRKISSLSRPMVFIFSVIYIAVMFWKDSSVVHYLTNVNAAQVPLRWDWNPRSVQLVVKPIYFFQLKVWHRQKGIA